MAYLPSDAKWYVAEVVQEITVEGDSLNVVHKNLVLIRADSPEDAYEKAMRLGSQSEVTYKNPYGSLVSISFRGLGELNVIYDELEHGAELLYEERIGVPNNEIEKWILPKEQLAVFRPIEPTEALDYSSQEILEEAKRLAEESAE